MINPHRVRITFSAICFLLFISAIEAVSQQTSTPQQEYVPPELQASDPQVKGYLDSSDKLSSKGDYIQAFQQLQKALDLCTAKGFVADKALVEARLGGAYFVQGKLTDAKQLWLDSFADAVKTANLVLQADALVALSGMSQASGNPAEALDLGTRALDLARKSKNLFIQSRCFGELGNLQHALGKQKEARTNVEEALSLDRLNHYSWEPWHLLYLAWITADDSKLDGAMQLATSARELAIQKQNYLVFSLASGWLGQALVRKGHLDAGIKLLELSRDGVSEDGKPLFSNMPSYRAAMALPFPRITILAAIGDAYKAGQRVDDELKTYQELYDSAKAAGFTLAAAGASAEIAVLHQNKKEYDQAITYYALAAEGFNLAGNTVQRINALSSEAFLLGQQAQNERAAAIYEELVPLVKSVGDTGRRFLFDLSIAEMVQPKGDLQRTQKALEDAESLLSPDLSLATIEPKLVLELYVRMADLAAKNSQPMQELVALEKGMNPAEAVDANAKTVIGGVVREKLNAAHAREAADQAYANGRFTQALLCLELIQHFEQIDAQWNGKSAEYAQSVTKDEIVSRLLQLPSKIIAQAGGAEFLETNLQQMGPVARAVKIPILMSLVGHYMTEQRQDMVVKFLSAALPSVNLQQPAPWDVAIVCNLALSLMQQKQQDAAIKELGPCLETAVKVGDPNLLAVAHQTNYFVLSMAGKSDGAKESAQYLLDHSAQDPAQYAQMAQLQTQQGKFADSVESWQKALHLFEARKDLAGMASAHVAIATDLDSIKSRADEEQNNLESALALYKTLGSSEGQARTSMLLGKFFTEKKDAAKARNYFDAALKLAREAKSPELEANVLSEIGQAYRSSDQPAKALESFRASEKIYHAINNPGNEAWQLRNEALALNDLSRFDEAMDTAIRASHLADASGNWVYRYWTRRLLADGYANRGDYRNALTELREARSISDAANQPLNSAWAALSLAAAFSTLGQWEEALADVDFALPIVRQFNDTEDEFQALNLLIDIYGARESELKDLDKAVEYYESASRLVQKADKTKQAVLDLSIEEIYWQQGRFKEAIEKATAALTYFKKIKDDWGQPNALISLAEAQRSAGDLRAAEAMLTRAEPLVKRANNFYITGRLYYGQANLLKAQGRFKEAIDKYEHVVALLEQVKSTSDLSIRRKTSESYGFIYDELVDTYYRLADQDPQSKVSAADSALRYAELNKARIFTSSWGQTFVDVLKHELPAQLQERERELSARNDSLQSELQREDRRSAGRIEQDIRKVQDEQSALQQEIRRANPAYAAVRYPQPSAIKDLPLHPDELLVEFKFLPDSLVVWMVRGTPNGHELVAFYKVAHPKNWFAERITSIRDAFNRGQPDLFDPHASEELFLALFPEPFARYLSAKRVVFIPDDVLYLIPFEVLSPKALQSQFPLLSQSTSYFPSAAAFRLSRVTARVAVQFVAQFLGIADPITSTDDERYMAAADISAIETLEGKSPKLKNVPVPPLGQLELTSIRTRDYFFTRLPDTALEVKNIAALFSSTSSPSVVRIGIDATKRDLLQTDLGRFRFIHFATHGFFPVEPGIHEPALILSYDGKDQQRMFLTLSEILQLKLRAEMVVLSACNTGSGKVTRADGVSSLGTAFLAAGASSATMSLWKVSDKSTAIFMQVFYRNLVNGMSKSDALGAARSTLFAQGYKNPFFWGSFVLTGE